jgi:hypothetical protein
MLGRLSRSAQSASGNGVWRSLVARFVRDEEAVGSNPATPTQAESRASLLVLPRPRRGSQAANAAEHPD